jgi:GDPmannose 4,6-dehydratase
VAVSFETPLYTGQVDALGVLNLLEAVRVLKLPARIYQASTSELFSGDQSEAPQNELTPFKPRSPYGVAKLYAYNICRIYRESYGMYICNGILFNHESPRRGENFVTRKITLGIRDILRGKVKSITLGNMKARRDWGYAPEYVEAMWLMLQRNHPDDYVVATGETHSVEEFAKVAFAVKGMDYKKFIKVDKGFERPNEVWTLCGNPSKARSLLGWEPKVKFAELVRIMVEADTNEI